MIESILHGYEYYDTAMMVFRSRTLASTLLSILADMLVDTIFAIDGEYYLKNDEESLKEHFLNVFNLNTYIREPPSY
jgi:hypothetical protein